MSNAQQTLADAVPANPDVYPDPMGEFGQWLETNGHDEANLHDGSLQKCIDWWAEEGKGDRETLTLPLTQEAVEPC